MERPTAARLANLRSQMLVWEREAANYAKFNDQRGRSKCLVNALGFASQISAAEAARIQAAR